MKKVFLFKGTWICSKCRTETRLLYIIANTKKQAERLLDKGEGICDSCLWDFIQDNKIEKLDIFLKEGIYYG